MKFFIIIFLIALYYGNERCRSQQFSKCVIADHRFSKHVVADHDKSASVIAP